MKHDEPPEAPFMADPDMKQLLAELEPNPAVTPRLPADVTPNAEETARLLAQLETKRRQEIEVVARRLAKDAEFARAVFAELARIDPARFASLTKL
jgi:hypothetical protein